MISNLTKKLPLKYLTLFLLSVSLTTVATAQQGQISLTENPVKVGAVLHAIEQQARYRMAYNSTTFDTTRVVTLPGKLVSVKTALENITQGTGVHYLVRNQYIAIIPSEEKTQVSSQRTGDEYYRNDPQVLSAQPVVRPVEPDAQNEEKPVVQVTDPAPLPEQYSDYKRLDLYQDVQNSFPRFGIKMNLLYGAATLTPNIGVEVAISRHSTIGLSYSNNPWKHDAKLNDNEKFLHGMVKGEYRYWLCERYNGHFLGAHALYTEYNISGYSVPLLFKKDYRYKGYGVGGGISYGYALPIGKKWNLEFTAGLGVVYLDYDRFGCKTCDSNREPKTKTYFGPTQLGINLVFLIK